MTFLSPSLKNIRVDSKNPSYCSIGGVLFNKDKSTIICCPAGRRDSSYSIPTSVTTIGKFAFLGCSSLTSVIIPKSIKVIADYAFDGCESLRSVYYGAKQPIEGGVGIFSKETYERATLYLSEEGEKIASTIEPWKCFRNIEVWRSKSFE